MTLDKKYVHGSAENSHGEQGVFTDISPKLENASPSQEDLDQIWEWNASVPDPVQGCVHDLITEIAKRQPDALAVHAWDGNFEYSQLDALADKVARSLIQLGAAPKSSIPLLFSKSRWTSVAMLGVIKAGCSAIALDATQPDTRLRSIVQQAQPRIIVSSAEHHARVRALADVPVFQLDDTLLNAVDLLEENPPLLPVVSSSDTVYISFTSYVASKPSFPNMHQTHRPQPGTTFDAAARLSSCRPLANPIS